MAMAVNKHILDAFDEDQSAHRLHIRTERATDLLSALSVIEAFKDDVTFHSRKLSDGSSVLKAHILSTDRHSVVWLDITDVHIHMNTTAVNFGVSCKSITQAIGSVTAGDVIQLMIREEDPTIMYVRVTNDAKRTQNTSKHTLLNLEELEEISIGQSIVYSRVFAIDPKILTKVVRDTLKRQSHTGSPTNLLIRVLKGEISFASTHSAVSILAGSGVTFIRADPKAPAVIENTFPARVMARLGSLKSFRNGNYIRVYVSRDMPMTVELPYKIGTIKILIAPEMDDLAQGPDAAPEPDTSPDGHATAVTDEGLETQFAVTDAPPKRQQKKSTKPSVKRARMN